MHVCTYFQGRVDIRTYIHTKVEWIYVRTYIIYIRTYMPSWNGHVFIPRRTYVRMYQDGVDHALWYGGYMNAKVNECTISWYNYRYTNHMHNRDLLL